MKTTIIVDNLKCGGCAGSIKKGLSSFSEVDNVNVNVDNDSIEVSFAEGFDVQKLKDRLHSMGYPERGSSEGFDKLLTGAKSYVSCAIGKFTKEGEEEIKK